MPVARKKTGVHRTRVVEIKYDATKHWLTKEGDLVPIRRLEDNHLLHVISLMERQVKEAHGAVINAALSASSMMTGEMASYYIDQEIERMSRADVDEFLEDDPVFTALLHEALRRELPVVFPTSWYYDWEDITPKEFLRQCKNG